MARYASSNIHAGTQQNLSATFKTIIVVTAATGATTLRRGWMDEIVVGADGAAVTTDCQILWNFEVQTAAGTVTANTPQPTPDGADAAALLTYGINGTAEGTYAITSSLLCFPTNQRQSQRIQYADFRISPLIIAAVNLKGIAMLARSTNYNVTTACTAYVVE
jgi:hypothetical protein